MTIILHSSFFTLQSAAQGIITTVAGSPFVFRSEGGLAINAPLGIVTGIAIDPAGNVLATDVGNHLVVKISPAGLLTIVAGNGIRGFSGDGGPATSASLDFPSGGVALDGAGNVYIADTGNQRVRKVSSVGTITTVAGNGLRGFSGDGGPGTGASLNVPSGVAVDAAGNLYITDLANHRIRKLSPGGIITTMAGNGVRGFSGDGGPATNASLAGPDGVAVDAAGNVYVADTSNHRIRRVSTSGIISSVAGDGFSFFGAGRFSGDGGPATSASLNFPSAVALDAIGNLYIADAGNQRVRRVSPAGIINTVAGSGVKGFSGDSGPAVAASVNEPSGVVADAAGILYIADTGNQRIRRVNPGGTIVTVAGNGNFGFSGDGGPATVASLFSPSAVAVDAAGTLYIADTENQRIRKVSSRGAITTVAGNGIRGFSGDGGPATAASLAGPAGLAVDATGNVYIVDTGNQRIRKVSPTGTISTVAGNGSEGFSGDGGPAVSASLSFPKGVAVDGAGNVYVADTGNQRIRRVNPGGTIATVAGNGTFGFSGEGGLATAASLAGPTGAAVDGTGSIYVADTANHRIRRVSPGGTITTVAGNGVAGFSGDNGPAITASLNTPSAVAVDTAGNLYIADSINYRMRRVNPSGIATVAGNGVAGFSGDGGPATSASLAGLSGVAVDTTGNLYIADNLNNRIRRVLVVAPAFSVAPSNLTFSAPAGAAAVTPQQISVSSAVTGLAWSAQASTESGGNWLAVLPTSGSIPGTIAVSANVASLAPGTYRGVVTVQVPLASPPTQTVFVQLTVTSALAAQLSVEPVALNFETTVGAGNPPAQALRIGNGGGGTLTWTARVETAGGANWLVIAPALGSASASSPATIQVIANVAGLAPGVYSGSIRIESSTTSQAQRVAGTLLVSQVAQTILVSQSGLTFTGVEGGRVVPSQTFGILNTGQGVMNWTVEASTLTGGNWLSVSPNSGRSEANSLQIPLVDVQANVTGMRAGQYGGLVRVEAPGASNSPQFVAVVLSVLPAGSNPGVLVRPTGLIFATQAGTSSPSSQTVRLATATPGSVEARSGLATFDGGNWLEAVPRNAVLSGGDPRTITIQPILGSLTSGVYRGALTLLFADGSPSQVVNVLFLVVTRAAVGAGLKPAPATAFSEAAQQCVPLRLFAVHRTLGSNFASPVGWPSPIEVQLIDDCGNPVPNATVVASFSNGDPPIALASLRNGIYVGTWRPVSSIAQVTVTVRASFPPLTAEVEAQGQVSSNPTAPALFDSGIVNGASFTRGEALAPGSIVSVFGRNLAQGENLASRLPLETALGGVTLNIGGRDVPLFFSGEGQINAQLPFELAPNSRPHVVVKTRRDGGGRESITVPETITIAAARPGIFSTNQQGSGPGTVLDGQGRPVESGAPARVGDIVQVFCTGLGVTEPRVASGEPAPAEPLARVVVPVEARIGGRPATVHFAGLAPGFVGLYQVNVEIPADIEPGPEVPLVLFQQGVPSNTVTIAVR